MLIQKTKIDDIIQVVKGRKYSSKQWENEDRTYYPWHGFKTFTSWNSHQYKRNELNKKNSINNLAKDLNGVCESCGAHLLVEDVNFYAH
jgi:ATP:corrinoid adenosyltransferase